MNYKVYTDASANYKEKVVGCAFIILGESTFIHCAYFTIMGMTNPTQAETISVGLAAKYMLEELDCTKEDMIEIYTDCKSTIDYCNKYSDNNQNVLGSVKVSAAIREVRALVNCSRVRFCKVRGHKNTVNANKYVDKLAKLAVRL